MKRRLCTILALMLAFTHAGAQFYSSGDDPGGVRWHSITSNNFRIIYPAGSDSLALRYGLELERWRLPLSASIGYTTNASYSRPLPVILHAFTAEANGSVTWAPRRMDLYTCPDATSPEPMPWVTELSIHESRHSAQMQFTHGHGYGLFGALTGELFAGALAGLYPGPALLEGDAVAAETSLSRAGRGRSADFLEYYRVSFAEGDFRDFYRWRWRSQKVFTPDHYRAGYMLVSGMRYVYDDPLFSKRYYGNILSPTLPLPFFVLQKTIKQASGKSLKASWQEIAAAQQALWAADEAARGPFGPVRPLTPPSRRYTEYLSPESAGGEVYAIQKGLTFSPRLVRVRPDGKTSVVRPLTNVTEQLRYSESSGRLFWSETVPDPRWTLKSSSRIFYIEPGKSQAHALTREGNLFNPSPAPDGLAVAVTEYPVHGGTAVRILDGSAGTTLERYPAPDSLQVVETAWSGGTLVASAISDAGFGLYDVKDGYRELLSPSPVKIKQLRSSDDGVLFVSDGLGVNELYRLGTDGNAVRLTNHRFGASDFLPDASGDSLTFAALTKQGRLLYREAFATEGRPLHNRSFSAQADPAASLVVVGAPAVVLDSPARTAGSPWPVADRLSEQEVSLAAIPYTHKGNPFSEPKPYRKLTHLFRLHSWAPVFIDYDAISNASVESIASSAGLGATAFLQNDLGTATAILGYSAARTVTDGTPGWDHSFHGKFTYRGLYPVIELSSDIGGRMARQYHYNTLISKSLIQSSLEGSDTDTPHFLVSAKAYIPFVFSRNGWLRGFIPQVSAALTNDMVNTTEIKQRTRMVIGDKPGWYRFHDGTVTGRNIPLARVSASVRGYTMLATARSGIYPRWGIGAETGINLRPGLTELFAPSAYGYVYGYVPGLMDTHGIRLSALHQHRLEGLFTDTFVNILPRGMTSVKKLSSFVQSKYGHQTRLTFDYAMPLLPLDWSGPGPVAFVRNFELTLHGDACLLGAPKNAAGASGGSNGSGSSGSPSGSSNPGSSGSLGLGSLGLGDILYSAGADFSVRLANLLWIPATTRVGVSFNYNGYSVSADLSTDDISIPATHFGLILTVDLP